MLYQNLSGFVSPEVDAEFDEHSTPAFPFGDKWMVHAIDKQPDRLKLQIQPAEGGGDHRVLLVDPSECTGRWVRLMRKLPSVSLPFERTMKIAFQCYSPSQAGSIEWFGLVRRTAGTNYETVWREDVAVPQGTEPSLSGAHELPKEREGEYFFVISFKPASAPVQISGIELAGDQYGSRDTWEIETHSVSPEVPEPQETPAADGGLDDSIVADHITADQISALGRLLQVDEVAVKGNDAHSAFLQILLSEPFSNILDNILEHSTDYEGRDATPEDLKFASEFIFDNQLNFDDMRDADSLRVLARILYHEQSKFRLQTYLQRYKSNKSGKGRDLRKVIARLTNAWRTLGITYDSPLFTSPNTPSIAEALFVLALGRHTNERDHLEKVSLRGHDVNLTRFLTSAAFERDVLNRLLEGGASKRTSQLTQEDTDSLSQVFGTRFDYQSEPDHILVRAAHDPNISGALFGACPKPLLSKLKFILASLQLLPVGDTSRPFLVQKLGNSEISVTFARSDLEVSWSLTLDQPVRYSESGTTDLAALSEPVIKFYMPVLDKEPHEIVGRIHITWKSAAGDADGEEIVPVFADVDRKTIDSTQVTADKTFNKARGNLQNGRFSDADALLKKSLLVVPYDLRSRILYVQALAAQGAISDALKVAEIGQQFFANANPQDVKSFQIQYASLLLSGGDLRLAGELLASAEDPGSLVEALIFYLSGALTPSVKQRLKTVPGWLLRRLQISLTEPLAATEFATAMMSDAAASPHFSTIIHVLVLIQAAPKTISELLVVADRLQLAALKEQIKYFRDQNLLHSLIPVLSHIDATLVPDSSVLLPVATYLEKLGKWEFAVNYVTRLLQLSPTDVDGLQLMANLQRKLGNTEVAIGYLMRLPEKSMTEKLSERLLAFELDAVKKNPLRPRASLDRLLNKHISAKQKALFSAPNDPKVRLEFARINIASGRLAEARAVLEHLLEESPTLDAARIELIRLARETGDDEAILYHFGRLSDVNKSERLVIYTAKSLRNLQRFDDARALLVEFRHKDTGKITAELIRSNFYIGDFDKAAEEAESALNQSPDDIELRLLSAAANIELGNFQRSFFDTNVADILGGAKLYSAEMPLFLYAAAQKVGLIDYGLSRLNEMFVGLSVQTLKRNPSLPGDVFDQLVGTGVYADGSARFLTNGPLVSVIMTTFNVAGYVKTAVRSILEQTYQNIELIIVDDASDDATPSILMEIERQDPRVRVILKTTNSGTYVSKNIGLLTARGKYIALQDSDDWSHPDRISASVTVLEQNPDLKGLTTDWLRMTTDGSMVIKAGGQISHLCCISLVFRRDDVLGAVGFFDSVRIAADLEFIQRIGLTFGADSVPRLKWPLLFGRARSDSLTASEEFGISRFGFTEPRQQYHDYSETFHAAIREGASPYIAFPLENRAFPAPDIILPVRQA